MTSKANDYERLTTLETAVLLGVSYQALTAEVRAGLWDGCYIYTDSKLMKGDIRFIPKKCYDRLDELAEKTAQHARSERLKEKA